MNIFKPSEELKKKIKVPEIKGNVAYFFIQKTLAIVAGLIVLFLAHLLASFLRNSTVRKGQQVILQLANVHKGKDGDYTTQEIKKQANKTNLIYITIGNIIYYTIMVITFVSVLRFLGVEAASIIAILGATGFAIGLALQGTLTDISSGILLAIIQLYAIGDIIEINGKIGEVKDFTLLNTVIEDVYTRAVVTIPNRKVQEAVLINYTRNKQRMVFIDLLVSNKNKDFGAVIDDIRKVVVADPKVLVKEMEPVVGVESMSSAGTLIRVRVLIASEDFPLAIINLRTNIRTMLSEKGIELIDPSSVTVPT